MIYLDNGATSFPKPKSVQQGVVRALNHYTNPGRGGYPAAMGAAGMIYQCRELAGELFRCEPEQVVFTSNCTHGLNLAIYSLVKPGNRVLISGFEHNSVVRPLRALEASVIIAGRKLFDWEDTLEQWEKGLRSGVDAAVFTHVSNVFGYALPAEQMAGLCRRYGVPFILDAAQSAGMLPVDFQALGAQYVAMPGHKGLLGPQGTGILLCRDTVAPLLYGGTGNQSLSPLMPEELPERAEAGTVNVPGIAGLLAGMRYVKDTGVEIIGKREHLQAMTCASQLKKLGFQVYSGPHQTGTVSFRGKGDCEELADMLGKRGIGVRAGLHCAPLAHESAGTLKTGTVRVSFGHRANRLERECLVRVLEDLSNPKL